MTNPGAEVRSIDAVRDWRAALADYADTLSEGMAGIELELRRAADWIGEQAARWQRAVRECEEEVTRAKAELAQRKFPNWDGREPDCTVQEKNLRVAKARLEHAEDQVVKCRQWLARLPKVIEETYTGAARRLGNVLDAEVPKGLADLARRIAALESYAGLRTDYAPASARGSDNPVLPPPAARPGAHAPGSPGASPDRPSEPGA